MKLPPRRISTFLRAPDPEVRAILVYGPDTGLVSERVQILLKTAVEDPKDPFQLADLSAASLLGDPARLGDEAASLTLGGGGRAVRVSGAGDGHTDVFAGFLEHPPDEALVVIEAGDLAARSRLRRLFEAADNAAALPCYADTPEALAELVRSTLAEVKLEVTSEAVAYLVENLGGDRLVSRSELDKLVIYKSSDGADGTVGLDDAMACVGDSAALSLEDLAFAVAGGDQVAVERTLARSLLEGASPVAVLRAAARHLQRLHLASGLRDGGADLDSAVRGLRPPVFFKRVGAFKGQLRQWNTGRIARALDILIEAERDCKTTGMPAEAVCGRALMRIAQAARAGAAR
jgi:DNA polymerase-3 subunit delta